MSSYLNIFFQGSDPKQKYTSMYIYIYLCYCLVMWITESPQCFGWSLTLNWVKIHPLFFAKKTLEIIPTSLTYTYWNLSQNISRKTWRNFIIPAHMITMKLLVGGSIFPTICNCWHRLFLPKNMLIHSLIWKKCDYLRRKETDTAMLDGLTSVCDINCLSIEGSCFPFAWIILGDEWHTQEQWKASASTGWRRRGSNTSAKWTPKRVIRALTLRVLWGTRCDNIWREKKWILKCDLEDSVTHVRWSCSLNVLWPKRTIS